MIISVTGSAELEQIKDMYCEEGGKINMCEAIRGMIEDGRIEGVKQGLGALVEVCRELGLSRKMWFPGPWASFPCPWMRRRI